MSTLSGNDPEFNDVAPKPKPKRGFRFVEVLVVLGIIGLLFILLVLPFSRSARPAAFRSQCANNLRQIALALQQYELTHSALPPSYTVDANGRPLHSWRTLILPYLDQERLYQTIDLSKPWNDPANAKALESAPSIFRCPESTGPPSTTTYLAIAGANGCLSPKAPRRLAEITDAHGSTLMVIEAGEENAVPWMAPVDADESLVMSLGPTTKLHHQGGMNVCFVDGSVRYVTARIPARVRRALMSIAGNDDDEFAQSR